MDNVIAAACAVCIAMLVASAPSAAALARIDVRVGSPRVGMGRTLAVDAVARLADGSPAAGRLLLPYVNGRRWGAHEYADARGAARFLLPMPNPGRARVQVAFDPKSGTPVEEWIWAQRTADAQTVYAQGLFDLPDRPRSATLWFAVDDAAEVYLNGRLVATTAGWTGTRPVAVTRYLRRGANVCSVRARNGSGPAGILARIEWSAGAASGIAVTGGGWRVSEAAPGAWPQGPMTGAAPATVLGRADRATWSSMMSGWPTVGSREELFAGAALPPRLTVSAAGDVEVTRRPLRTIAFDPDHLVGMQWEPWFTPMNASWGTAQAVPLSGFFWSWNLDVMRQHMLWMVESGIDFLVVDWTNHLWDRKHWDERPDPTNEIIHCTTLALEMLASMRDEGIRVPKMTLLTGLNNGPATTMEALNEEHAWVYHNYVRNPRFKGLWLEYQGKPLILPFNGGGPGWLKQAAGPPVDETHFTVRWNSSQHQIVKHNEAGYWSWMDGSLRQPVTLHAGKPEAMTVSAGFFAGGGWLAPDAYGRRNGWTLVESFRRALEVRPRFIQLHQFNEYAGQTEGQGYGPRHDVYVDSYSPEFSDDIEPTSLTAPAYRGEGGWGFVSLNLTRALVDLYHQRVPETTVVAIGAPLRGALVRTPTVEVTWTHVGRPAAGFTVLVNRRAVARGVHGDRAVIDLAGVARGDVTVRVVAEGTKMRYAPLWDRDALPLSRPVPAYAEVTFRRL